MNTNIITKSLTITLISSINFFSVVPLSAQVINCSNYWTNPNTGNTECFENLNFNESTNTINNRRRATPNVRTSLTTKEKLNIFCNRTYADVNLTLHYTLNAANIIARNLRYRTREEQKNILRLANRVVQKAKRYDNLCQSNSGTAMRAEVAYREFKAAAAALYNKVGKIK